MERNQVSWNTNLRCASWQFWYVTQLLENSVPPSAKFHSGIHEWGDRETEVPGGMGAGTQLRHREELMRTAVLVLASGK